ncbi:MAG: IS1595 family transposase [Bacteroidota bacterium]
MNTTTLKKSFGTQAKCIAYLEKLRWGKTYGCVHCGATNVAKRVNSIKWHCNSCNQDYTVLYGTIFEDTQLPLPLWFEVANLMINAKMGMSAVEVSENVGISYRTSWYCCHRIRCAMITNEIRLEGIVEFDEAYIGGKKRKRNPSDYNRANLARVSEKRGRGTAKIPIVAAIEKQGRAYVKIVEKLTSRNLLAMLKKVIKTEDSIVVSDDFKSYKSFDSVVEHITIKHKDGYGSGIRTVNTAEGFFSLIKNGIKGSYRSLSKKYLPFYLAEFSYKFNKRNLRANALEELLENAVKDEKCFLYHKPTKDTKEIAYGSKKCKI